MPKFEKTQLFDMEAPLEQALRCLDLWLAEEKLFLEPRKKKRVAALLARYFYNEDILSDQLIISFLRHYSGWHEVDMEDVGAVRMEIKRVLDKAQALPGTGHLKEAKEEEERWSALFYVAALVLGASMVVAGLTHSFAGDMPVSRNEQQYLRSLVDQVVDLEKQAHGVNIPHQRIWSELKKPLTVRSYQDMSRADFEASRALLETKIRELSPSSQ